MIPRVDSGGIWLFSHAGKPPKLTFAKLRGKSRGDLYEKRDFNQELRRDRGRFLSGSPAYPLLPGAITDSNTHAAWCALPYHVLSETAPSAVKAVFSGEATGIGPVVIFFLCLWVLKVIPGTASFR